MSSTNYINTFIAVAEDCPVHQAEIPPAKAEPSIARRLYELINTQPYTLTSDELIYLLQGESKGLTAEEFWSKPQACLRSSALGKRYGFGLHFDELARVALYPMESNDYQRLIQDQTITQTKAMRSKRKNT